MKVRVTLMTENDKHIPPEVISDDDLLKKVKEGWDFVMSYINLQSNETNIVENVEIIER